MSEPLSDAELDRVQAEAHKRFDWTILRLVADLRAARAELDRIKSHNGECGTCDGWHQCCNALGTAEAKLAAVLELCRGATTEHDGLGCTEWCWGEHCEHVVTTIRAAALGEAE